MRETQPLFDTEKTLDIRDEDNWVIQRLSSRPISTDNQCLERIASAFSRRLNDKMKENGWSSN